MVLLYLFLAVVFVEGATELICKSLIFAPMRERLAKIHPFVKELLSCGYCTSVWVALVPAALFVYWVVSSWLVAFVLFVPSVVILHRLSNYLHNFNDKHLDKYYSQPKDK